MQTTANSILPIAVSADDKKKKNPLLNQTCQIVVKTKWSKSLLQEQVKLRTGRKNRTKGMSYKKVKELWMTKAQTMFHTHMWNSSLEGEGGFF